MVLFGGHAWFYSGGCAWFYSRGVHGFILGACMVSFGGGMHGFIRGACMVLFGGACVVFSVFSDTMRYGQWAGGTHPTGMHSCLLFFYKFVKRSPRRHLPSPLHGSVGTPAVCATMEDAILSPSAHMAFSGGPMNMISCLWRSSGSLGFSEAWPHPAHTAWNQTK